MSAPSSARPVILHVLESYGAGSARAAEGFAAATPEFRHVVLRHRRAGESVDGQDERAFDEVLDLPAAPLAAMRTIRRTVRRLVPRRIHAHSSYAGAYVRLALPRSVARRAVVYSPHCFAFERQDLPAPARSAFRVAERLLAPRTGVIAACSAREAALAAGFSARRDPVLVPNVSLLEPAAPAHPSSEAMVGIGRLGPQKDPDLFAAIARRALSEGSVPTAVWAGDGDGRDGLEEAGVQVLGWRGPEEIAAVCAEGAVYVHTARWEGFPLAVLEAARSGLPVVARRIPAMLGMPADWLFDDEVEAAALIRAARTPDGAAANRAAWADALAGNTAEAQRAALLQVYSSGGAR